MRSSRFGAMLLLGLTAAACHKMTPLSLDEVQRLRPSVVWITDDERSMVPMAGPQVFNDTIVGYVNGEFTELPASQLTRFAVRQPARGKTIALFAAGTVGVAGLVWMVAGGNRVDDKRFYVDCQDDPELPECQMN